MPEARVIDEDTESLQADLPLTNMGMTVHATPQLAPRVIEVDACDVVEADDAMELPQGLFVCLLASDLVPCGKDMACVHADADAFPSRHAPPDGRQMLEAVAEI